MRTTELILCFCIGLITLSGCDVPEATDDGDANAVDRDNTAVNERDADADTVTPLDQGQGEADVERTADIRSKVLEIDDLSVDGQNVKIITNNGKVTLRGPVESADEKATIERIATEVAGAENVTSQIEIAAD